MAQAYFLRFDPKLYQAAQPSPPLGSLICAAVLRERGFDVRFFDAMLAASEEECAARMDREKPDALVIFEDNFNYLTKMCLERMREAASRLIGFAKDRGIPAIVSGSDASDDPVFYLRAGASAVAAGEGEYAVAEWLGSRAEAPRALPGIVTWSPEGGIQPGPSRPPVTDVDSLPSPAWDLIDVEAYRRFWARGNAPLTLPLATSRGCPFHCNWCAKPIWGQRYNAMSPPRAAREVRTLKALGASRVNVLDDIFGLRPGWLEEFAAEVERLDCRLPFKCLTRAGLLDERSVRALRAAGCDTVWIGAESGSQKVLDAMEKGTTVEEIRAAAARLQAAGIKVAFFLQFGYPGETEEDVEATLRLIDEARPDDIGISVSYPLPGTRFHTRVKSEMGRETHWRDSSDLAMLFRGPQATPYYRSLHAYAHARFRLALTRRRGDLPFPQRLARVVWYSGKLLFSRIALGFARRGRVQVRPLSPGLSRELAATPSPQPSAGPSES